MIVGYLCAQDRPDAEALAQSGGRLTYRQLDTEVRRLAGALARRGVGPGDLVALALPRGPDLVAAVLAVHWLGAAFLPVDPGLPGLRREQLLTAAGPAVVVDSVAALVAGGATAPSVQFTQSEQSEQFAQFPDTPASPAADDLAYAMFTSGSTGRPKLVAVPHGSLAGHARAVRDVFGLSPADRVLQFANPAFDVFCEEVFPTLLAGATLVVPPPSALTPSEMAAVLREEAVSVANLPTPFWEQWVRDLQSGHGAVPAGLRLLVVGSDVGYTETLDAWWRHCDVPVVNAYGLTETTITSTVQLMTPDTRPTGRTLPVGRPLPGVRIHLLDEERRPVADGSVGEVYVGGSLLARGYIGEPALTAERFVPDPDPGGADVDPDPNTDPGPGLDGPRQPARMFRTGDRARRGPDGVLELLGRTDDQVKIRGQRVELGEVAAVLRGCPGVHDVHVRAVEDPAGGKRLIAYAEPDTVSAQHLRAHAAERLPAAMVPSAFVLTPALPRNAAGKVDHRALPSADDDTMNAAPLSAKPSGDTPDALESSIAAIWCEVLRTPHVGLDDRFFDIGGHSLLLVQVQRRLATELGHRLAGTALFAHPTVRSLAAHIRAEDRGEALVPRVRTAEADQVRDRRARLAERQRRARSGPSGQ